MPIIQRMPGAPVPMGPRVLDFAAPSTCSSSPSACRSYRTMILADTSAGRTAALDKLLPYQRADFAGLFNAMDGLPVIIRLIDPPLHEFMPDEEALLEEVIEMRVKGDHRRPGSQRKTPGIDPRSA